MSDGANELATEIHITPDARRLVELEAHARTSGWSILRLSVAGLRERSQLIDELISVFSLPAASTRDLDGALDWMSDLSWFGNDAGYLVIVDGSDTASSEVVVDLFAMLPYVGDRMRTGSVSYVAVLAGSSARLEALGAVTAANKELERFGQLPWAHSHPVLIVDYGES